MVQKCFVLSLMVIFAVSLSGCATGRKSTSTDMEIQGLKNQIVTLESQVQAKDEEIYGLKEALNKTQELEGATSSTKHAGKKKFVAETKSRPSVKQIQTALLNAGYNPGSADGKMGRQTKEAIRGFQSANNISADGKVGKKTWSLLKEYLNKKVK